MKYIGLYFSISFLFIGYLVAQEKEVSSFFLRKVESSETVEFAKLQCIELAKADAIRRNYGEVLIQGNSTFISNTQANQKVETYSRFNMIADSWVNGEWVRDISAPKTEIFSDNGSVWVKANVTGVIRPVPESKIDFNFATAQCPKLSCETTDFKEGDDLFVIFKTPESGYLSIFLDDPFSGTTYMVFPYQGLLDSSQMYMERDREYVLFDKSQQGNYKFGTVDELVISLSNKTLAEVNKLFIVFSPNKKIMKPNLSSGKTFDQENNFFFPSSMKSEDFQFWIAKLRSKNKDIQFSYKYIQLKPLK